jgi:hypothetical protein
MRKLALATAAAAALAFSAPAFAQNTPAPERIQLAQADVKVKIKSGENRHVVRKKVVVRHDRGHHYGWRHRDARSKTVIVKKRGNGTTVIKKKTVM